MVQAWYMDSSNEDQRLPHKKQPEESVSLSSLKEIGVHYWHLPGLENDDKLQLIREEHKMSYSDIVDISPETLPGYEDKLKMFYKEHLHDDDEIRFIIAGSGYFDVRGKNDQWIRIALTAGDMISLPAGIYHRFTMDENNYAKAMRLFVGEPVWTAHNRPEADDRESRKEFIRQHAA